MSGVEYGFMRFTLDTKEFRRALRGLLPHTATDPEFAPHLMRVRMKIAEHVAVLSATNRLTAGLATVSVVDHLTVPPVEGTLDLPLADTHKLLAIFSTGSSGDYRLEVAVHEKFVEWTDVSGLVDGERLRLPRDVDGAAKFPDLASSFAGWLAAARVAQIGDLTGDLRAAATGLAAFKPAARLFGDPIRLTRPAGARMTLVHCGSDFLGAISTDPSKPTQSELGSEASWLSRLPSPVLDLDLHELTRLRGDDEGSEGNADESE